MCFKKSDKPKYLTSRIYYLSSGVHYAVLLKNKKTDRLLTIQVTNNKGTIDLIIYDKTFNRFEKLENPQTGEYEFLILKDHGYKVTIITKSASGGYSIYIKDRKNVY